ncbi:iron-sulfur cluster assembly 2 homolog, mitochondrial-like [Clytia hemisphaerica]
MSKRLVFGLSKRCYYTHINKRNLLRKQYLQSSNLQVSKYQSLTTDADTNLKLNIDGTAITQLQKMLEDSQFLRVLVEGGGCSGFQYKFEVDTEIDNEEDLIFENDGVKVVSDIESVKILNGSKVEYHVDLIRAGFRVTDIPMAEKGCSCGVSFSVKL